MYHDARDSYSYRCMILVGVLCCTSTSIYYSIRSLRHTGTTDRHAAVLRMLLYVRTRVHILLVDRVSTLELHCALEYLVYGFTLSRNKIICDFRAAPSKPGAGVYHGSRWKCRGSKQPTMTAASYGTAMKKTDDVYH